MLQFCWGQTVYWPDYKRSFTNNRYAYYLHVLVRWFFTFFCPGYFSPKTDLNSMKLWEALLTRGDVHIFTMFRFIHFSQSYCPFNLYTIWYWTVLSGLFLSNYLLVFNATLWEASLTTGDVNIITMLRIDVLF